MVLLIFSFETWGFEKFKKEKATNIGDPVPKWHPDKYSYLVLPIWSSWTAGPLVTQALGNLTFPVRAF